ncbi:hypothetical protein BGZ80_005842 [Entomortierella chlamydospora]|uniref:Opi1-domain-containing protein n=1 Tax=Entomortierella chlamydospora TaxID=101097 RepID=A0A9P6N0E5_9FUNG|nr:hypothetical protein BGZ79_007921 [Entomortierella chlamydospora]KAG0019417.1 hypothetical protein BGZ80_005842 [Entomortierella chlamydospora]
MPPAPARDQAKVQPMSISQLCQQNDSDEELVYDVKQELDHDPLDLNLDADHGSIPNNNSHHYSNSSDEFEELDDSPRARAAADQRDADEQLAAEALGDMANGARTSSSTFAAPATPFISRMSSLPLVNSAVNSALKAYESGKQNSKVMKYGAEMVESGVKSLSKPVFDKLEPKLGQLDDFACRQLDKVYPTKSDAHVLPSPTSSTRSSSDIARPENGSNGQPASNGYFAYRSRRDSIDSTSSTASSRPSFDVLHPRGTRHEDVTLRQRSDSQASQRSLQYSGATNNGYYPQQQQQLSGWKGVVATVGSASAAGVAIFSEESMKSLRYCLQWLQYAVQHIDHQIGLLKAFLVSLANPSQNTALVPSSAASTLASIKKEVVDTLRKVITVVSRYAGACLPDQAKISVRQFILSMPVRWATISNESIPSTPMGSPSLGPQSDRNPEQVAALNETSERATKVLVLAHESSDMLKSVASIFKDSVDKAENWMDKLRYVGMNPQSGEGLPSWAPTGFPNAPGSMPGGFPGSGNSNGSSNGLEQYSLRQTQHTSNGTNGHTHTNGMGSPSRGSKGSPRMGGRENHRHAYRQRSVMSGDEDSGSDEEDVPLAMDDSEDEDTNGHANGGHAPLKRSMGSTNYTQGNAVRRRKKRGESAEVVAGLGVVNADYSIKQEPN